MELPESLQQDVDRVNRLLATQGSMVHKLEAVAEVLERTVHGADSVSIALVVEGATVTGAASSQLAIEADLVQYGFNQGPCLLAVQANRPVRIDVLRQDERFEHFAPGALERGVEGVLSIPLRWTGIVVGSINIYAREPNAFGPSAEAQVQPIALYAAEVIAHSPLYAASLDLIEGLVASVQDADDINTAIGLLIGSGAATDEGSAWEQLRTAALADGSSVADTARRTVIRNRSAAADEDS